MGISFSTRWPPASPLPGAEMSEEQQIRLARTKMTLSFRDGYAVYSPKDGVMSARYPKFYFPEGQFRELVGEHPGAQGKTIIYKVVSVEQLPVNQMTPTCRSPKVGSSFPIQCVRSSV